MKFATYFCAAGLVLSMTGCASVAMAPADQDAQAKTFQAPAEKAALYVYRNENFGAAIPMTVSVNGKVLGQTAAKTYFLLNLAPGKYDVEGHAENLSTVPITAEAGKRYYVWQEVKMGMWMARNLLQQVDEERGKAGVTESKLIAATVTGEDIAPQAGKAAVGTATPEMASQKLRELQRLMKDGVISESDFQVKKKQILGDL